MRYDPTKTFKENWPKADAFMYILMGIAVVALVVGLIVGALS